MEKRTTITSCKGWNNYRGSLVMKDHCEPCYFRLGCIIRINTSHIKKLFGVVDCPCFNCIVKMMCHTECPDRAKKAHKAINGYI